MAQIPNGAPLRAPPHWQPITRRRPPGERLDVWQAVAGQTFRFDLRGPLVATFTHWDGRSTLPCVGPGCAFCPEQKPRWKGYLGGYALQEYRRPQRLWSKGRCVVEITAVARINCPRLALPFDALAGRLFVVWRRDLRPNAEVMCGIRDEETAGLPDRRPVDARQALLRLWCGPASPLSVGTLVSLFDRWSAVPIQE
jgi:hypothetical protein